MRIFDTIVLLAFLDPADPRFFKANEYVLDITSLEDIFVPSAVLLEFDLELKAHGIVDQERDGIHSRTAKLIPARKILSLTPSILGHASRLTKLAKWRAPTLIP